MSDKAPTLVELRDELDKVNKELLSSAAKRLEIVKEIHLAKQREGKALFDPKREREVFEKSTQTAKALGLDEQTAKDLTAVLIEAAQRVQEESTYQGVGDAASEKVNFLIVGGNGRMGKMFSDVFQARGHRVDVIDKGQEITSEKVSAADVVMLAVSMDKAVEVAKEVSPLVREDALLCDINSLKKDICEEMAKGCNGQVLGMHPMFGPTKSLRRQKVVLCSVKDGARAEWFISELGKLGCEFVVAEPEVHDNAMAIIQVLMHFHTMVMGEALKRSGTKLEETLPFVSPVYRLELALVGRLFAQDPGLYAEIEMANPKGDALREEFIKAASDLHELLKAKDKKGFSESFEAVGDYFKNFSQEAVSLSNDLIDTVVKKAP